MNRVYRRGSGCGVRDMLESEGFQLPRIHQNAEANFPCGQHWRNQFLKAKTRFRELFLIHSFNVPL